MFRDDTVFIIGAGASWHYGYPTGQGLVERMRIFARRFRDMHVDLKDLDPIPSYIRREILRTESFSLTPAQNLDGWKNFAEQCDLLDKKLTTIDPLVIDYFLSWNKDIQAIGKLILATVILEAEARYALPTGNYNRPKSMGVPFHESEDNWYRFVLYSIVSGCSTSSDLTKNKVKFVTFNYDTSLDLFLWRGLSDIKMFAPEDVDQFLGDDRIFHVYGKIRDERSEDFPARDFWDIGQMHNVARGQHPGALRDSIVKFLDYAHESSTKIHSISPDEKDYSGLDYAITQQTIKNAKVVIILGYGFDTNNNTLLGLREALSFHKEKRVYFTNKGDINVINKRASSLMYENYLKFLPRESPVQPWARTGFYAEKSTRNVHDALAQDFDCLEL